MSPIFETGKLLVRKLKIGDFEPFHEMQGNPNVMKYVRERPMTYKEDKDELAKLIDSYDKAYNDFWIYAVEQKDDGIFIGTVALVKDADHGEVMNTSELTQLNIKKDGCEIGYRLLEKYWGNGYGTEIVEGLIKHCKKIGFTKLIAFVANENVASAKIIEKAGFKFIGEFVSDDLKIPECKFILKL